jgi:2-methylcitrate synthase
MSQVVAKGLDGVVVDNTAVSHVMPETSSLTYRGYRVHELADQCSFEEVAFLMLYGELPGKSQLEGFTKRERSLRKIDANLVKVIELMPRDAHPMDAIRTGVSYLGMHHPKSLDFTPAQVEDAAVDMLAKIPTIVCAYQRIRRGNAPIEARADLSFSENFFHMYFGKVPDKRIVKAFDVSMVLYAEHSFNASTFTCRVVTSTLSDIYSAITSAIGALKGPLHGGANEEVMYLLKEIGDPAKAQAWITDALAQKKKVMGFGHRVYKKQDSRAPTMDRYAREIAGIVGEPKWHQIADIVEKTMISTKNIYPNLDFPSGLLYYLMGIDIDQFTPLFVMSRITGWSAHFMEQAKNNRLIRPLAEYTGSPERSIVPIDKR